MSEQVEDDPYAGYVTCACGLGILLLPGTTWLAPGRDCDRHGEISCGVDRDALARRNARSEWICYQFHDQVVALFDEATPGCCENADQDNFEVLTEHEKKIFRTPAILRRMLVEAIIICGFKVGDLPVPPESR